MPTTLTRFPGIWLLWLLMVGCQAKPAPASQQANARQLHFGQGGGFSGLVTHYMLTEDGRLYRVSHPEGAETYLTQLDKRFASQMFTHFTLTGLDKQPINEPGNMYRFLELREADGKSWKLTWGAPDFATPPGLDDYHLLLMKSTKPRQ